MHHRAMLRRTKLGIPTVAFSCGFFFLAGFYGSLLFRTQDLELGGRRMALEEVTESVMGVEAGSGGESVPATVSFQVLSWKPRAMYFPKFATAEQCKSIIKLAKANLAPSSLALREGETEEDTKGVRTSSGVFLAAREDKSGTLDQIEKKIARVTMMPQENGEAFNILRYEIGQKYSSHYDAFNPDEYGPQSSQRIASFLLYLSDVEEGGETMFPYENGLNMDGRYDYEQCIGLRVKPRQGDGLLFYSLTVNGTIDPYSLHGSCPVIKGEKWVATKWIRTVGTYQFIGFNR